MSVRRVQRINELIREEISELLRREIKDPRITGIISVTEVDTSPDLRNAKIYVSIMGSEEEKQQAEQGLIAASGFIRHELGERVTLRRLPELHFKRDESIERGSRIITLIDELVKDVHVDEVD